MNKKETSYETWVRLTCEYHMKEIAAGMLRLIEHEKTTKSNGHKEQKPDNTRLVPSPKVREEYIKKIRKIIPPPPPPPQKKDE